MCCVGGPTRGFRVKLGGEEGLFQMFHSLVGVIVEVQKEGLPSGMKGVVVDGKSMVLRSNVGFVGTHFQYGLVVTAVAVL